MHVSPEAPRPRRVNAVEYSKNLENGGCGNRPSTTPSPSNKVEGSSEEASFSDFLIHDIDQNQFLIADDSNSKVPQMEEDHHHNNKVELITNNSPWILPYEEWIINLRPFPTAKSQIKFFLAIVDYFTKWIKAKI